jgi:RNA methyltransferase, TrmH family
VKLSSSTVEFQRLTASEGRVRLDGLHALKHALRFGASGVHAMTGDRRAALALAHDLAPDTVTWLEGHLVEVPAADMATLTLRPVPTGVVSVALRPGVVSLEALDRDGGPIVALENPRHLGNIGAVIRVAAAAGALAVVTTGTADPWHPQCLSGSAGLHFALTVQRIASLTELVATGRPIVALDPDGEELQAQNIARSSVFLFGTERGGLTADALSTAHSVVSLPMRPGVSSLNLATSVAATLYSVGTF